MFGAMDMSGGPAGWDLEEMETGAELNVAVPMPSRDDEDLPWPSARTPESEDLPVDAQKVQEISGFGPKPSNFLLTPLYFVRVSTGIRQLRAELRRAESELAEAEKTRDERLAELAEARRAELSEKDRFAPLYANADRYDSIIQEQQRSLEQSDAHAAQDLARVEDQLLSAKADREEKQAVARQQLEVRREGERNVARQRALLKRLEIEERNIVDRARRLVPAGADMPAELAGPYSVLQEEKQSVQERIAEAEQLQRSLDERHAFADDELGRTIAELQRIEGQKEALLMTHEGRMAEQARAIEESRGMRLKEKAHAGRSIVELHGEVPLERDTRLALLASDQAVERAAVKIATIREALHCYDGPAYGMGRGLLIATGSALLLLLLYVLVM